jgi:quinol monooxygenase YgiN
MSIVTVVAKVVAQPDAIEEVKAELLRMIEPTRKEEGCREYRLHQDNADPAVFVFYENWDSMACLERHLDSPHFKEYVNAVGSLIAEKAVHLMTELGLT